MSRHVARARVGLAFLLSATFVLFSLPAVSQTLGEVTGRVTDVSSAAVPGAVITLTNVATNAARSTISTEAGDYTFPSVPPGIYNVKAEHSGFKFATTNNVEVQVQQTVRLDLTLASRPGQRVRRGFGVGRPAPDRELLASGTVVENKGVDRAAARTGAIT